MKKIFVALEINDELAQVLSVYVAELHVSGRIRMVPPENYHITAHFIGGVDEEVLGSVEKAIYQVAISHEAFKLHFDALVFAPLGRRPTMLWGIFKPSREFRALTDALSNALSLFSRRDSKEHIPHVTLARFKEMHFVPELAPTYPSKTLGVDRLTLMESLEAAGGIYYRPIRCFDLKK